MAEANIPGDIYPTCIWEKLFPPPDDAQDLGPNEYAWRQYPRPGDTKLMTHVSPSHAFSDESEPSLGVELRQMEVLLPWEPNFEYTLVPIPVDTENAFYGGCNRESANEQTPPKTIGPKEVNLMLVMRGLFDSNAVAGYFVDGVPRERPKYTPIPMSIGGIELSDRFGTLTVLANFSRRTYEGVMLDHANDFNYASSEIIVNHQAHPCRSEEEDAPPCTTSTPLIRIGTISAKKNLIKDSLIEVEALKDNLYTEIKGSILAASLIDSKELLIIERSQIVNSTVISRHFTMGKFSTASGMELESNGLCYLNGIKGFFATGEGEDSSGITLSYVNPDGNGTTTSPNFGVVDSVITQSSTGLLAIDNSTCDRSEITTPQFYCKDTIMRHSSIDLKANLSLHQEGIIEQMKAYAAPFHVETPDLDGFEPNGESFLQNDNRNVHNMEQANFVPRSGHGLGDKYICAAIECPEMFVPVSYNGYKRVVPDEYGEMNYTEWYIDHEQCVDSLAQSGCAQYNREYGITEFRRSAATLIGTTQAVVEFVDDPQGGLIRGKTLLSIPNPTYLAPEEPQVLAQGIPHSIEDSTFDTCDIKADADVYLSNVTLRGECNLALNKNTMVKGYLILQDKTRLDTFAVSGFGEDASYIQVMPGSKLNVDFIDGVNLNNIGETFVNIQTNYDTNIENLPFGAITWVQPLIHFVHQGIPQHGRITVTNGVFKNGGTFIYTGGELRGNSMRTEDGTGPGETRSTRQTIVRNERRNLMKLSTLSMHGPNKSYDSLHNSNSILQIDNILLKGQSHLLVTNGLVLSNNIEVDEPGGVISLFGGSPVFDEEGNETRPTPGFQEYDYRAPTRVNASSIKANFINFDQNTIISGSQLIQSGAYGNRMNKSNGYLKINDISLIAKRHGGRGRTSFYGTLGGHVECGNLRLQSYWCGASISGSASIQFEGSTNASHLMDGQTSTFSRSINVSKVDNATFSNGSASIELAANSVFEDSAIGGSLSGSIQATNCVSYLNSPRGITYPNNAGLYNNSPGSLELLMCSANFTDCNFEFGSIIDKIYRYTFFGQASEDVRTLTPNGEGGFNAEMDTKYSEQSFTALAKTQGAALSLVYGQVASARESKPDYSNYEWRHNGDVISQGISTINMSDTRLVCLDIIVANLNVGKNSHLYVNQRYSANRGSHADMKFNEVPAADLVTLVGPDASIRLAVFDTMQVPEKCYLYQCKLYDVQVSDKGKTLGCYIKYGKWNGSNAFSWAGQTVDYTIENIDIETGELYENYNDSPSVHQSSTAEEFMGPINENIQQLRRYTNEAVLTEPRTLEYSNLEYDTEQDITKITMPLSFVDLRNSYNKKIHYKDLIIDSASNNSIGEIIGANASLNQVYISGNIQNNLSNASGIVSSVPAESSTVSVQQHQNALLQKVFESYSDSPEVGNIGSIPANTDSTSRVSPAGYSGYDQLSDIPVSTNPGVGVVPFNGNPVLQIQGRSGGSRIIRGSSVPNETIKAEASLASDKTFNSFAGRNQNNQFTPSNFEEVKAVVLNKAASKSVTRSAMSNYQTPILGVDLIYSSNGDYIGDGEFNSVNINSHILGSLSENKPTQLNKCGGYFTLGSETENTFLNFNGSIAWSMTITQHTSVTFDGKSYLCGEGMGVPGSLFFEGGSTNNSSLSIPVGGLVRFNSSFNNANMNGGTVTFSSSTNWGELNVQSVGLYNSTNLWKITTDPITTTTIENIKNLGEITSTYINAYGMNEGITQLLAESTGFDVDGRAGYFKLFTRENPPEDHAALGLYYDSVRYTIQAVEQVEEGYPGAVLNEKHSADGTRPNQWVVRHAPLDASAYFDTDSFIAQQFLLPFKGSPYSPPSRWPYIYMEETFFHPQA